MPNYQGLKAELANYTGQTDAEILAALNGNTVEVAVDVPIGEIEGYLRLNGIMSALQAYGTATGTTEAGVAARELTGLVMSPHMSVVQMSDPAVATAINNMLDALVTAGQLTSAQQSALLALAVAQTSIAAQLGWPGGVAETDLAVARALA